MTAGPLTPKPPRFRLRFVLSLVAFIVRAPRTLTPVSTASLCRLTLRLLNMKAAPNYWFFSRLLQPGLPLAKSVIDLITTIIKARADGVKKGDRPADPLELIVRRAEDREGYREEIVFRIAHQDHVDPAMIEEQIEKALKRLYQK